MRIRRGVVASGLAMALLVGGAGCGKVAEKAAEKAIEHSGECDDVDIKDGGVSGTCGDETFDADLDGASLPADWPAELALPAGAKIILSNSSDTPPSANVTAGLDGEINAVYDGIKTQLTEAGYTIDSDSLAQSGSGLAGSLAATGPVHEVHVVVTESPNAIEGNLSLVYTVTPAAG